MKNKNSIKLKTKAGIIPLEKSDRNIWMKQNDPDFFKIFKDKNKIAKLIGLLPEDISDDWPIEEVSTGNTILLVPIRNLSSIRKATGIVNEITDFIANNKSIAPYLFTLDTENKESKIHTRLFAPHLGIIEDPATGSAAGPLTAYLLKYNIFGKKFEIQNEQGIEIKRPSKILMRGSLDDRKFNIEIGGKCHVMGQSEFNI